MERSGAHHPNTHTQISDEQKLYTIGDMARDFGVSLRALRFYEDRGLLHPRRQGLARYYNATDRLTLQRILKGKQLGFTLTEIREMLMNAPTSATLSLQPKQILTQIDHLERQRQELDDALLELRAAQEKAARSGVADAVAIVAA